MSDAEFREWMQFYAIEPWGGTVDWYRTGTIAAMVGNTAPNRKPHSKAFRPEDFVPKPRRTKRASSKEIRKNLFAALGVEK